MGIILSSLYVWDYIWKNISNNITLATRFIIFLSILIFVEFYAYQAVRHYFSGYSLTTRNIALGVYIGVSAIIWLGFFAFREAFAKPDWSWARIFVSTLFFLTAPAKIIISLILIIDDVIRVGKWIVQKLMPKGDTPLEVVQHVAEGISRNDFLVNTALGSGALLAGTMSFGILSGAHDYRVRKKTLLLPNLPKSFDGITIAQISDVHSGSFYNKVAVKGGIETILNQKPDMIFFTGDLVNDRAVEMKGWVEVFSKLKAPMGVYSTLGNHDYGDYAAWSSVQEKQKNLQDLIDTHKQMGWNIMMNENKIFSESGDKIAVLGIENFGAKGHFPKYGKLDLAHKNTEEAAVKILLSHDPSHWDYEVNKKYKDIDLMFAGHTHGMQFGIEIGDFRWSPVQYMYDQWADLYKKDQQYLYVNRGFGYIGFPGRVGILPEITVITLKKA